MLALPQTAVASAAVVFQRFVASSAMGRFEVRQAAVAAASLVATDGGGEGDSKGGGGGAAGGGGNGAGGGGVRRRRSDVLSCYCHLAGRRVRADGPRSTEISRDQPRSAEITTEVVVALAPAHRAVPRPPPWSAPTA